MPNAQSRPPADELIAWINDAFERFPRDDMRVRVEWARDFELLFGIAMHSIRAAKAYVWLREQSLGREGHANVRAAFEHAIIAQWAFFSTDGQARLRASFAADRQKYLRLVANYTGSGTLDRLAQDGQPPNAPVGPQMPPVSQILRHCDTESGMLRLTYKTLSLGVHPTFLTVGSFLEREDNRTILRDEPRDVMEDIVLHAAAMAAMFAVALIEFMLDPDAAVDKLDRISTRLLLPLSLNDSLDFEMRRFPDWPPPVTPTA